MGPDRKAVDVFRHPAGGSKCFCAGIHLLDGNGEFG